MIRTIKNELIVVYTALLATGSIWMRSEPGKGATMIALKTAYAILKKDMPNTWRAIGILVILGVLGYALL